MTDYYEIDFLEVHTSKSGDAIAIRYEVDGLSYIHAVDGGYLSTGSSLVQHIKEYYNDPIFIDNVVVTHPDKDHAEGLVEILRNFTVGCLWILRPWLYAEELIPYFSTYTSIDRLRQKLKNLYPFLAKLEEVAEEHGVEMKEPFQGAWIGHFVVLTPSKERYLRLVLDADRTPASTAAADAEFLDRVAAVFADLARKAIRYIAASWGEEKFSDDAISCENEMSVVQYACLNGDKILLTADAGLEGLDEAANFATVGGISLPGIDKFQVPHHGSRRNVSSEMLDRWLGPRLDEELPAGSEIFTALISSAREDEDHPRKSVLRALIHRGARLSSTEQGTLRTSKNAPARAGWSAAERLPYPTEQEE